jgi:hypothetical protein
MLNHNKEMLKSSNIGLIFLLTYLINTDQTMTMAQEIGIKFYLTNHCFV